MGQAVAADPVEEKADRDTSPRRRDKVPGQCRPGVVVDDGVELHADIVPCRVDCLEDRGEGFPPVDQQACRVPARGREVHDPLEDREPGPSDRAGRRGGVILEVGGERAAALPGPRVGPDPVPSEYGICGHREPRSAQQEDHPGDRALRRPRRRQRTPDAERDDADRGDTRGCGPEDIHAVQRFAVSLVLCPNCRESRTFFKGALLRPERAARSERVRRLGDRVDGSRPRRGCPGTCRRLTR